MPSSSIVVGVRNGSSLVRCFHCPLMDNGEDAVFKTYSDMLIHVKQHVSEGHQVPGEVLDFLEYMSTHINKL